MIRLLKRLFRPRPYCGCPNMDEFGECPDCGRDLSAEAI